MTTAFTTMPVKITTLMGVILRRFMGLTVVNKLALSIGPGLRGFGPSNERSMTGTRSGREERFAWAGPVLFAAVALALVVFFWWLL